MPIDLVNAFFNLLYIYRGEFVRCVDELLGPAVIAFIEGKRPLTPIPFGQMNMSQMEEHPMDSEYFIKMSQMVGRNMSLKV